MTDVSVPRNLPSEMVLTVWRWIGWFGFAAGQITEVIYFGLWARHYQSVADIESVGSPYPVVAVLVAVSIAFAILAMTARHVRDKYYRQVPTGVITGFDTDINDHTFVWLSGENRVGQSRQERVYVRNAMKWRKLNVGDTYTQ